MVKFRFFDSLEGDFRELLCRLVITRQQYYNIGSTSKMRSGPIWLYSINKSQDWCIVMVIVAEYDGWETLSVGLSGGSNEARKFSVKKRGNPSMEAIVTFYIVFANDTQTYL